MTAQIIDGKAIAEQIREEIKAEVARLGGLGITPGVATILVGDDGGAQFYRGQIEKNTGTVGLAYFDHSLPAVTPERDVLDLIARLNADPAVHGILALMPMAEGIDQARVFNAIDPLKDLDCVNPANVGHVLLVNHSNIVGKPAALLCLNRNASVHVVHVFSKDVPSACRGADVLISAAPVQNLIKGDMVKEGAIVVDVTTIRVEGKQVGSLEFDAVAARAAKVTPVPGGVGPVTNVMLLKNALAACVAQTDAAPA
jgi:methylenetetrahydrofolate dehydrogenase (NADP+)/methenyltetrahydrofolate cyclohydrolase